MIKGYAPHRLSKVFPPFHTSLSYLRTNCQHTGTPLALFPCGTRFVYVAHVHPVCPQPGSLGGPCFNFHFEKIIRATFTPSCVTPAGPSDSAKVTEMCRLVRRKRCAQTTESKGRKHTHTHTRTLQGHVRSPINEYIFIEQEHRQHPQKESCLSNQRACSRTAYHRTHVSCGAVSCSPPGDDGPFPTPFVPPAETCQRSSAV